MATVSSYCSYFLCRQLKEIAALYCPLDIHQYLVPIVNDLLVDKVAEVRHMSIEAVSLLHIFSQLEM